jgi:hypothetical protein
MPVTMRIDTNAETVFSDYSGCVTDADVLDHQNRLRADPNFRPHFRQLWDLRAVTQADISPDTIRTLAANNPFGQGCRRAAIVQNATAVNNVIRLFMFLHKHSSNEFQIFFDADAARTWLGLDKDAITPPAA